jgi:hypothetical protein
MARNSIFLFLRGKLFANPAMVYRRLAIGIVTAALIVAVLTELGVPVWAAALLSGLAGGLLQPYLFKDLRYR